MSTVNTAVGKAFYRSRQYDCSQRGAYRTRNHVGCNVLVVGNPVNDHSRLIPKLFQEDSVIHDNHIGSCNICGKALQIWTLYDCSQEVIDARL